ncbi:MAG: DedA family protein [Bacteroidia bacterium]|nr:DedA family protein [Bacteroidia bacterium]
MEEFLDQYGYIALFVGTFFEGETAILVASSLIYHGDYEIPSTVFFGFAGSFVSDWLYYLIGRVNGKYFIERRPKLLSRVQPVRRFFQRHKLQVLFTYRFLYGFRVIIPLIIGMSDIKPMQYLGYSVAAGLIWASVVSGVGYVAGRFMHIRTHVFEDNLLLVIGCFALLGIAIGLLIRHLTLKQLQFEENNKR